jgi:abequosyltransferase
MPPDEPAQKILLSIAIPTRNGADLIRNALESILPQLTPETEIVVSDNASTDDTPRIVEEYRRLHPAIRYFRNDENLGADRNFDLAVRRSEGEFVWLFGDDDRIEAGGVEAVLSAIRKHPGLCALFVNYGMFTEDPSRRKVDREIDLREDVLCESGNRFLETVNIGPVFLSSNVVNRARWVKAFSPGYVGTNWIQYVTLLSLAVEGRTYCIAHPFVLYHPGAARWIAKGQYYVNMVSLVGILQGLPRIGYDRQVVRRTVRIITRNLRNTTRTAKNDGLPVSLDLLRRSVARYRGVPAFWFVCMPMLLIPAPLYQGYKRFEKKTKGILKKKRGPAPPGGGVPE